MFLAGSGVRTFSGSWSNCMNTRFPSTPETARYRRRADRRAARTRRHDRSTAPSTDRRDRSGPPTRSSPSAALDNPLTRDADRQPGLDRLLVGPDAELVVAGEHGDPDVLLGEPEALAREIPGEADGLLLEIVTEAEVAQHLEEREVSRGRSDDLDIRRAERLLAGRDPRMRGSLGSGEIGLERMHPGHREQRRGVELGGNQRPRRQPAMVALLEEAQVAAADLVGGHRQCSVGGGRANNRGDSAAEV